MHIWISKFTKIIAPKKNLKLLWDEQQTPKKLVSFQAENTLAWQRAAQTGRKRRGCCSTKPDTLSSIDRSDRGFQVIPPLIHPATCGEKVVMSRYLCPRMWQPYVPKHQKLCSSNWPPTLAFLEKTEQVSTPVFIFLKETIISLSVSRKKNNMENL